MMPSDYWKTRCLAAESALQRSRSALPCSRVRRQVLHHLGELRPGESLTTQEMATRLGLTSARALMVLQGMVDSGWIERSSRQAGGPGNPVRWWLGHMVQVAES